MRNILLICLLMISCNLFGQESEYQYFALTYTIGSNWDTTLTVSEQPYFKEHSAHLKKLKDDGKIAVGARYGDNGLIILKVKDESEARTLLEEDVSVRNKTFEASILPFNVFYFGCLEKE